MTYVIAPASTAGRKQGELRMSKRSKHRYVIELLAYFYPIHYQVNMVLEDFMRGSLTRKEAALLWLVYEEGGVDGSLPRKLVVDKLNRWFEATSSNVTKILAHLESPKLGLVRVVNEHGSARDKRVGLTARGRSLVRDMLNKGAAHPLLTRLSEQEIRAGIAFFRMAYAATRSELPPVEELI
jgi:DNA-binding MarR family transcriptional regulator